MKLVWATQHVTHQQTEGRESQHSRHAITLLMTCYLLQCIVSIENPARSWLGPLLAVLAKQTMDEGFITWYFHWKPRCLMRACVALPATRALQFLGSQVFSTPLRCAATILTAMNCGRPRSWMAGAGFLTQRLKPEYPALLARLLAARAVSEPQTAPPGQPSSARPTTSSTSTIDPRLCGFSVACQQCQARRQRKTSATGEELEVAAAEQSVETGVKVGISMEPGAHIARALQLLHPMDSTIVLPDPLKKALFNMITKEPAEIAREGWKC